MMNGNPMGSIMPMNGNPMGAIMQMMSAASQNPQMAIQQIMNNNPEFVRAIQGQDPKQLALQMMQQKGINPNMLNQFFNR